MAVVPALKKFIQDVEIKYKSAVSESTWYKIAGMINFIGHRVHQEKQFFLNGPYWVIADPQLGLDGLASFEFDCEIFNVIMFNLVAGSTGTTELDLKLATSPGGTFTSIFSTTPKISWTAVNNAYIAVGGTLTGATAPVLTGAAATVAAGSVLRLDKIQSMPDAQNCGLIVHYRPR